MPSTVQPDTEPHPAVELVDVGKRFGTNWIFRHVAARFPTGTTTAVVGESGGGKTTLLQLINGLHEPDEGEVLVAGKPIPDRNIAGFRRSIGYAVQGACLFPHKTAHENASLVAKLCNWATDDISDRVGELFEFMGLDDDLAHRYPYELSGGQQQRVGLCRALMLRPSLVLLDEPFTGIDPLNRTDIVDRFEKLQRDEKLTVVLVTHDLEEARSLSEHLVVMGVNGIAQQGPTEEVLGTPDTEFADLLQSNP